MCIGNLRETAKGPVWAVGKPSVTDRWPVLHLARRETAQAKRAAFNLWIHKLVMVIPD